MFHVMFYVFFIGVTPRGQVFVRQETAHTLTHQTRQPIRKKEVKQKAIRETMANPYKSGLAIAEDNFR